MRSISLLLIFFSGFLKAQEIQFHNTSHDFGRISEDIHYAKCRFIFTNTGKKDLIVNNVQTSCGCTTPDWSRDTISPGDSGFVDAKYETINRLGTFRKTITVYTNAVNSPFVHLDILGDVYKEAPSANSIAIPEYGKVYFDPETVAFDVLYDNAKDTQIARLVNGSIYSTSFQPLGPLPEYCQVLGYPSSLEPNETAKIYIILDGSKIQKYGFGAFQIPVMCDNPMGAGIGLFVAYTRKQYFPKLTAKQLKSAPKIEFDRKLHDFGEAETGAIMDTEFEITNSGKQNLIIHEIYPECTCLRVSYPKNELKPGESMKLKVSFDTVAKKGLNTQSIWVVSNDPSLPEFFVYIRAKLPEKIYHCPTCH